LLVHALRNVLISTFRHLVDAVTNQQTLEPDNTAKDSSTHPRSAINLEELQSLHDRFQQQGNMTRVGLFILEVETSQHHRCTFITTGNRFGYVLGPVLAGDQICLFDGARTPYLIRKCESNTSDNVYKLVGEVYLHGAMNGEVDSLGLHSYDITLT
jgi:hypothetical protein